MDKRKKTNCSNNSISVMIKRRDDVEQIVVNSVVVWGGCSADSFALLSYVPIDPSFLDAYSQYYLKSSIEGHDVAIGYVFAEVYYE